MKKILQTIIFILIFSFSVNAQSTPEPLYHEVYTFLARMAQKGVIEFNDEIRPLPRKYIFEKLVEVKEKVQRARGSEDQRVNITPLEIEELEFYLQNYNLEFALMSEIKGQGAEGSDLSNQSAVGSFQSYPNSQLINSLHSDVCSKSLKLSFRHRLCGGEIYRMTAEISHPDKSGFEMTELLSQHPLKRIIQLVAPKLERSESRGESSILSRRSSSEARAKSDLSRRSSDLSGRRRIIHSSIHPFIHSSIQNVFWFRDALGRYRLFSYISKLFKLNVDPILGYTLGTQKGEKYSHLWNGARFYGYISNWLGFSFDFRDNSEDGTDLDIRKAFTPETGVVVARAKRSHFEYSRTNTSIMVDWSWGDVLIGKELLVWGYGESGNIVHSTKAPSYPMIRLDLTLTKWLRFNYFHGWLASNVIDSNASYSTLRSNQSRDILRSKFITSHSLLLNPLQGLSISFGESVIYSDKEEFLFVFPLMFYRSADHYLSQPVGNNAGANSQFFLGISSRNHLPNTHLYGTLYIDELTLSTLFAPKKQRTQIAFQLGASVTDFPIPNLDLTLEYTKLYPFVYRHYIPTQTYENHGYVLGDWMGHNGDRIYGSIKYRILRGLQAELWGEYIRKGGDGTPDDQYITPQPPFLFGLRTNYTRYGAEVKYEITHDLFAQLRYNNFFTSREHTDGSFSDSKVSEFYFAIYYGM